MERKAYDFLIGAESSWWYVSRARNIIRSLRSTPLPHGPVLDYGAGFGNCLPLLKKFGGEVDAFEIDPAGIEACRAKEYRRVLSDEYSLQQQGGYSLVGAFDVIEHIEEDVQTLRTIHALLMTGGVFVANVPAFSWLWSEHDVQHHHYRRYTKKSFGDALHAAGFTVTYSTYWNCLLLPVAFLMRYLHAGGGENLSPATPVNRVLTALLWLESSLIPWPGLPWGISVIVVAKK